MFFSLVAMATDLSLSSFGTVGYAQSDQVFNYERFINDTGTLKRDTVFGIQADLKFTNWFGATFQAKVAPSLNSDSAWDSSISWAFLSVRPSNDWLIRLGKHRLPLFLYSEIVDVQAAYDFANLPQEIYVLVPMQDYNGVSVSKTWNPEVGEVSLDVFGGSSEHYVRTYMSNTVPDSEIPPIGPNFMHSNLTTKGITLKLQRDNDIYRATVISSTATFTGPPLPTSYALLTAQQAQQIAQQQGLPFPYVVFGGSAYYPENRVSERDVMGYALGAEIHLPQAFKLVGEIGRREFQNMQTGYTTNSGYLALLRDMGKWTPYVSYSGIQSGSSILDLHQTLLNNGITVTGPAAALATETLQKGMVTSAYQRALADILMAHDQHTIALGSSYRLWPNQKIKFEWARTFVGSSPGAFVDVPSGADVSGKSIDVLSLSFSFAF